MQPSFFLFGAERSGTTLASYVLSGQPGLFVMNDSFVFDQLADAITGRTPGRAGRVRQAIRLALYRPDRMGYPLRTAVDRQRLRYVSSMAQEAVVDAKAADAFLQLLRARYGAAEKAGRGGFLTEYREHLPEALEPGSVRQVIERALSALVGAYDSGGSIVGEKTPRHTHLAEWILDLYPDAKAWLVLRHPVTNVASIARRAGGFDKGMSQFDRFAPGLIELTGHPRISAIRYEDLVASPAEVVSGITSALGTEFDAELRVNAYVKSDYTGTAIDPRRDGTTGLTDSQTRTIATRYADLIERFYGGDDAV